MFTNPELETLKVVASYSATFRSSLIRSVGVCRAVFEPVDGDADLREGYETGRHLLYVARTRAREFVQDERNAGMELDDRGESTSLIVKILPFRSAAMLRQAKAGMAI